MRLVQIAADLRDAVAALCFADPVSHVYNPLDYAWETHERYLRRFGGGTKEALLLGMNPGPFGMAQTGVPFGEVDMVRDWLGIEGSVGRPTREHPKRPVQGFACRRSEVSGKRLWGWAAARFVEPQRFAARFFVANYCPLLFLAASGANLTPDRLTGPARAALVQACDLALQRTVACLRPARVIGVGGFAAARAAAVLAGEGVAIGKIPHPSPASPVANRGWAAAAERALVEMGVEL